MIRELELTMIFADIIDSEEKLKSEMKKANLNLKMLELFKSSTYDIQKALNNGFN